MAKVKLVIEAGFDKEKLEPEYYELVIDLTEAREELQKEVNKLSYQEGMFLVQKFGAKRIKSQARASKMKSKAKSLMSRTELRYHKSKSKAKKAPTSST